jgi:hypothetical protein
LIGLFLMFVCAPARSAQAEQEERGAFRRLIAALAPVVQGREFFLADGSVADARGWSLSERAIRQREVRRAHRERRVAAERGLGRLNVWEEVFVCEQVPDDASVALVNGEDAQQAVAAFELEDEIVAGRKL